MVGTTGSSPPSRHTPSSPPSLPFPQFTSITISPIQGFIMSYIPEWELNISHREFTRIQLTLKLRVKIEQIVTASTGHWVLLLVSSQSMLQSHRPGGGRIRRA